MTPFKQKIQLFGQRCSGTNFLKKLLVANFKDIQIVSFYGFKHSWNAHLDRPIDPNEKIKIVIIVRDPYDWIRSVYREPHHCAQLLGLPFEAFIRTSWKAYHSNQWNHYKRSIRMKSISKENIIEEFDNALQCRNAKMKLYSNILNQTTEAVFIKYEDLRDNTENALAAIQKTIGLERRPVFTQINDYKDSGKSFKRKIYNRISGPDLDFINDELEWDIESEFGYMQKHEVSGRPINIHRIQFLLKQWYYETFTN